MGLQTSSANSSSAPITRSRTVEETFTSPVPASAETGYGYIKCGASLGAELYELERFVEKPDAQTAQAYLESGDYTWNSGMFLFRPEAFLAELEGLRKQATMGASARGAASAEREIDLDFAAVPAAIRDQAVVRREQHVDRGRLDVVATTGQVGDLVRTGPTLTNVSDFRAILVEGR